MANPQTRRSLSMIAAIDKSNLDSDDPVLALVDIYVNDQITGLPTGAVIRIVNMAQDFPTDIESQGGVVMADPITFENNYYQPAQFDVGLKEAAGEIPEVSLTMHDISGIVRTYMDQYGGGVGFTVRLSLVWKSALSQPPHEQRAEIQESFQVTGSSIADRDVTLTLGAPSLLAISFPRRRQTRDFCQWQYKGEGCKYAGALPTCDRSIKGDNGCEVHDNVINFGGFPGIQSNGYTR